MFTLYTRVTCCTMYIAAFHVMTTLHRSCMNLHLAVLHHSYILSLLVGSNNSCGEKQTRLDEVIWHQIKNMYTVWSNKYWQNNWPPYTHETNEFFKSLNWFVIFPFTAVAIGTELMHAWDGVLIVAYQVHGSPWADLLYTNQPHSQALGRILGMRLAHLPVKIETANPYISHLVYLQV